MAKTRYNIIEITQKKTGITYIYEDYSYWNREKGYSTHKRKSIGKLASYTKVHFEGKYKDVYTVPTANQRHVFDMLELPYRYKGVAYNMPPKKESQKVDAGHSTTHDNEKTDEVPAT